MAVRACRAIPVARRPPTGSLVVVEAAKGVHRALAPSRWLRPTPVLVPPRRRPIQRLSTTPDGHDIEVCTSHPTSNSTTLISANAVSREGSAAQQATPHPPRMEAGRRNGGPL